MGRHTRGLNFVRAPRHHLWARRAYALFKLDAFLSIPGGTMVFSSFFFLSGKMYVGKIEQRDNTCPRPVGEKVSCIQFGEEVDSVAQAIY